MRAFSLPALLVPALLAPALLVPALLSGLMLAPAPAAAHSVTQPTMAGGPPFVPGAPAYATGFWYAASPAPSQAGAAGSAGYVFYEPVVLAQSASIDSIGVVVTTASATGGKATVYLYGSNTAGNRPDGLPLGQCEIGGVTATGFQSCTFSAPLGLTGNKVYWIGWELNSSATALVATAVSTVAQYAGATVGIATPGASSGSRLSLSFGNGSHTYGTPSNPTTYSPAMVETYALSKVPAFLLHVASVP